MGNIGNKSTKNLTNSSALLVKPITSPTGPILVEKSPKKRSLTEPSHSASHSPSNQRSNNRDSIASGSKERSEGRIAQWKNNKSLAKHFSKYEETTEEDKTIFINLELLINDTKLCFQKNEEERLFFQLLLLWQIAGGGEQAYQQIDPIRQNVTINIFFETLRSLNCHTVEQLENYLVSVCKYLKEENPNFKFADFYRFCFYYGKVENTKVLERDVAILLWKCLLKDKFPLLFMWCNFLEKKETKGINLDMWECFLDFVSIIRSDMSNFDPEGAWPSLIDEFVQYILMSESTLQNLCIKKVASYIRDGKISKKNLELLPHHFKLAIQQYSKIMTWNI